MKKSTSNSFKSGNIHRKIIGAVSVIALTYSASLYASWININDDVYIDLSSKGTMGFEQVTIRVLQDYDEISSEMMFGLSEVDQVIFDCRNSKYKSNGVTWYNDRMGKGGVAQKFGPDSGWSSIPYHYIRLFSDMCSPSP